MSKRSRTLDSFFASPPAKKPALSTTIDDANSTRSTSPSSVHPTYPFAVARYPQSLQDLLGFVPATEGRIINDQPDLDLVYYQPYIPQEAQRELFDFLRSELFYYRVRYMIKRGSVETQINTPRFTTVFGLDETSRFDSDGGVVDAITKKPVPASTYKCSPRPPPHCLDTLRKQAENATGCKFNFILVNYYATGDQYISYHSDDERFLGPEPAIASLSLGAKRDFLLRHKPTPAKHSSETQPTKFALASGDLILMRGRTQSHWLHSIPKRKSGEADKGRINITFRRAMVKGGTENYYRYNVGDGEPYRWDAATREMVVHRSG